MMISGDKHYLYQLERPYHTFNTTIVISSDTSKRHTNFNPYHDIARMRSVLIKLRADLIHHLRK